MGKCIHHCIRAIARSGSAQAAALEPSQLLSFQDDALRKDLPFFLSFEISPGFGSFACYGRKANTTFAILLNNDMWAVRNMLHAAVEVWYSISVSR